MAEATKGFGTFMENSVPSQLDEADLDAELELEIPGSRNTVQAVIEAEDVGSIEIEEDEDGGVTIDFDPMGDDRVSDEFYANLAEDIPTRELQRIASELLDEFDANKASRQDWEEAYADGLELLGFTYEERTQPFRGSSSVTHPLLAEAKKTYYDETMGRAVSKFVPAENLVVPYETSDLDTCPNITQVFKMSLNDLRKKQRAEFYRDIDVLPAQSLSTSGITEEINKIEGVEPSQIDYTCTLFECHVDLDLEGYEEVDDDGEPTGIKVPYIVTISEDNGEVLSIRRNYREEDELKKKIQYFTHFKFLPGFGFYGLGLIHTIGGLSRTATAALRQLLDAGTLANLPAGFKARGLRIRDDDDPLQPGEFRDVDAPGGAIRDSLMPLPFKGPDPTLFQLLGFVVQAGQRFATITDMKVGDGNQNAAVGTTIAMLEQGSRVMSAVHKRLHYGMRQEFKILSRVMSESLPSEYPYSVAGADSSVMRSDFDDRVDVIPVSNPNVFSQAQRIVLAQTKLQLAGAAPELHNMHEVYRDMYEALGVTDTDRIMKAVPNEEPIPIDPAQENIDALDMLQLKAFEGQNHQAHITAHLVFGTSPIVGSLPPVAMALQKHVMEHVKIAAQERALEDYAQQVQQTGQTADEEQMLKMEQAVAQFIAEGMQQVKDLSGQLSGAGQPDPLVKLKESELQLKAQAEQNDAQLDAQKLNLDVQSLQARKDQFAKRLSSQEAQKKKLKHCLR